MRVARQVDVGGEKPPLRGTKRASTRITEVELSHVLDLHPATIRARVKKGHLSGPGEDGLYDKAQAQEEFRRHPKSKRGRKRSRVAVRPGRRAPAALRRAHARDGGRVAPAHAQAAAGEAPPDTCCVCPCIYCKDTELLVADYETQFRILKNREQAIKVKGLEAKNVEVKGAQRRTFQHTRAHRDIWDALVSQEAPLIAARFGLDEGDFWRALKAFETKGLQRCADVVLNLLEDQKTETEQEDEDVEEEQVTGPKKRGRPPKVQP
jgi:hypothetical protein